MHVTEAVGQWEEVLTGRGVRISLLVCGWSPSGKISVQQGVVPGCGYLGFP